MLRFIAAAACLPLLTGCLLVDARRNTDQLAAFATVKGTVSGTAPGQPVYVVLYRFTDVGWERFTHRTVYAPGRYEFSCTAGRYFVFAFEDRNADLTWQPDEPAGRFGSFDGVPIEAGAQLDEVDFALGHLEETPGFPVTLASAGTVALELGKVHRGDYASLEEERFSTGAANLGLWQPVDFANKYGIGVSMLEPYSPEKIPVLFVHGAAGTPRDFAELIARLDHARYQAWVYSYPSGIHLPQASETLKFITDDLQQRYGFERLCVVAHSMGGLVARDYVLQVARGSAKPYVSVLVTLSTPWGGHAMAKAGVQRSPVVLPSWVDVAEDSGFLTVLLEKPLPAEVPHFLFFSFSGGDGDGTVSLKSQLHPKAQRAAARVKGFNFDHTAILKSAAVSQQVNQALAGAGALARVQPAGAPCATSSVSEPPVPLALGRF